MSNHDEQSDTLVLFQIHGKQLPWIEITRASACSIGRGLECGVQLTNRYVSRKHATIEHQNGKWIMTDLESRSGTYLNTIRMELGEHVQLHADDLVQIGPWKFLVRLGDRSEDLDQAMVAELDKAPVHEKGDDVPTLVRTINGRYLMMPSV